MANHSTAIRDGILQVALEGARVIIPGLGVLIDAYKGYSESIARQKYEKLLAEILPHLEEMRRFADWYSSNDGRKLLEKVVSATSQSETDHAVSNLASRVILGPNSDVYRSVKDITNAVVQYYQQTGGFRVVSREIYGDLPFDLTLGRFTGYSVNFMFYMCHDSFGNPCGRNSRDIRDSDTVIARVYRDSDLCWAAVVA